MNNIHFNEGQELIEQIAAFLSQKGFTLEPLKTKSACKLYYNYNSVQYTCYIGVKHELSMLLFYFIPPIAITTKREYLLPAAEYITRANYGSFFGDFELDFSDGEIRYKIITTWKESPITMNELMDTLESGVSVWSIYMPGLMSVLDNGISPEEAITRIRG